MPRIHSFRTFAVPAVALSLLVLSASSCAGVKKLPQDSGGSQEAGGPDREISSAYGSVSSEGNTHSTKTISVDDTDASAYSNIFDYINGRVPGLSVVNGKVYIRGGGSSSVNAGGSDPLVLMDGVEIRDISLVNPSEVHSINVILDSAGSIYGFRGIAGVIEITSKAAYASKQKEREEAAKARAEARAKRRTRRQ